MTLGVVSNEEANKLEPILEEKYLGKVPESTKNDTKILVTEPPQQSYSDFKIGQNIGHES